MQNQIKRIKEQTEKNQDYLSTLIRDLVRIRSYSGQSAEIQFFLKEKLESLGMETRLIMKTAITWRLCTPASSPPETGRPACPTC